MSGRQILRWSSGLLLAASFAVLLWNEWLRAHPPFAESGTVDLGVWQAAWTLMQIAPTVAAISLLLLALSFRREALSPEHWTMVTGGSVLLLYSAWSLFQSLRPSITSYTVFTSVQPAPPQPELWMGLGVCAIAGAVLVACGLKGRPGED